MTLETAVCSPTLFAILADRVAKVEEDGGSLCTSDVVELWGLCNQKPIGRRRRVKGSLKRDSLLRIHVVVSSLSSCSAANPRHGCPADTLVRVDFSPFEEGREERYQDRLVVRTRVVIVFEVFGRVDHHLF